MNKMKEIELVPKKGQRLTAQVFLVQHPKRTKGADSVQNGTKTRRMAEFGLFFSYCCRRREGAVKEIWVEMAFTILHSVVFL